MSASGQKILSADNAIVGLFPTTAGVLRLTTAGSVDDGKSTLIGRLLYDSHAVYDDQLNSVRNSRVNRSSGPLDFSLLTDGLRAEREQGITIDVAYRYFSTPRRKFIIADTPGHEQYTRNMATGASTADAAVVLIDATKGLLPQSRRHSYIASLLGIRHVVAAVNKMDLAGYSQEVFGGIAQDFRELSRKLGLEAVYVVPVSALEGDNVVRRSSRMPWFDGPALLEYLEELPAADLTATHPARFPVQYVIRPDANFRGFAGQLASGVLARGQAIVVLPSGIQTRVKSIVTFDGELDQATAGQSVTITLETEVDVSRGDLLVADYALPAASRHLNAMLVWMAAQSLELDRHYLLKHNTRTVRARITRVQHRVDVNSLGHLTGTEIAMNDIAAIELETTLPLFFDPYRECKATGSFVLIDPLSNATVAAGMIQAAIEGRRLVQSASSETRVKQEQGRARRGHPAAVVWVEGEPELAESIERGLLDSGWRAALIDAADFDSAELRGAIRALQLAGVVTVLSARDHDAVECLTQQLKESAAVFEITASPREDAQATAHLINRLNAWRATFPSAEDKS